MELRLDKKLLKNRIFIRYLQYLKISPNKLLIDYEEKKILYDVEI